ncbi:3-hydroxyacyl-CoA dehydrogenase family protein [Streptomyces sp. NPDC023723]|uniref:3-hydroxyacyl-CoA dehydrogenase family protein n=1 Tax=Streptomyces sp. NPDC023723 TaxID=3154323 RepID=UPI0033F2AF68
MVHEPFVVGIVGLGALGEPLLRMLCAAGHHVVGVEPEVGVLARVDQRTKAADAARSADGDFTLTLTNDTAALCRADLVIETVTEDLRTKTEVLRRLDSVCSDHTVLVSTTASLSLTHLAIASGRPSRTLGLRLLAPPAPESAAEPVRLAMSDDDAVEALHRLLRTTGLRSVALGPVPSRDATALVYAFLNRAVALCADGYIGHEDLDTALRLGCGLPLGPLEMLDGLGVDRVHSALLELWRQTDDDAFRPSPLLTSMVRDGALGRKTGRGIHRYDDLGNRLPSAQPVETDGGAEGVRTVGVVGSGTMARGIAQVVAAAGLRTVVVTRTQRKAVDVRAAVDASLTSAVRRGVLTVEQRRTALDLLDITDAHPALSGCDLVIEATAEDPDVKHAVFERLGAVCRPGAVLATTTSSLSVGACAVASGRPEAVLGLHFFNPAPTMRLVEVVRTADTRPDVVALGHALCRRLGKTPVECDDRTGFIVNRLLFPYLADAVRLLERHDVDIEETDHAVRQGFGFPMGPFALLDTIGLDVSLAILRSLHQAFPEPDMKPPMLLEQLVAQGCLGRKSSHGFHRTPRRRRL